MGLLQQNTLMWACKYCIKIVLKIPKHILQEPKIAWTFSIKYCDYLLVIIISIIIVNWRIWSSCRTPCFCDKMALLTWRAFNELINLSCTSSRGWSRAQWHGYLLLLSKCTMLHCSAFKAISIQVSLAIFDAVCKQYARQNLTNFKRPNLFVSMW